MRIENAIMLTQKQKDYYPKFHGSVDGIHTSVSFGDYGHASSLEAEMCDDISDIFPEIYREEDDVLEIIKQINNLYTMHGYPKGGMRKALVI